MGEFKGWDKHVAPAVLLWKPDDPDYQKPLYNPDKAKYSPEQEHARMNKQVNESDGFDIDFSCFRCVFNYHSAYLDSDEFVDEPETTGDLLKKLSQGSLDDYNQTNGTEYEFIKVVKANFHVSAGIMFLITFEVIDPYDKLIKLFQARVRHLQNSFTKYIFCRPKSDQKVKCVGTVKTDVEKDVEQDVEKDVQNDAKKQRLE